MPFTPYSIADLVRLEREARDAPLVTLTITQGELRRIITALTRTAVVTNANMSLANHLREWVRG
jgi:hypothetical protein